jgi:hypothetical protein
MIDAPQFTSLLGKTESSPEVVEFARAYGPLEIQDDPPGRRYLGSPSRGIDLLFEDGLVSDVQIFVRPSRRYRPFEGNLPFGLRKEMKQDDVHALLGQPVKHDEFDSKYELQGGQVRVTICYDDLILKYISIGFPLRRH